MTALGTFVASASDMDFALGPYRVSTALERGRFHARARAGDRTILSALNEEREAAIAAVVQAIEVRRSRFFHARSDGLPCAEEYADALAGFAVEGETSLAPLLAAHLSFPQARVEADRLVAAAKVKTGDLWREYVRLGRRLTAVCGLRELSPEPGMSPLLRAVLTFCELEPGAASDQMMMTLREDFVEGLRASGWDAWRTYEAVA
ncbi:MAG: hypothetical protein ACK4X1_00380 [Terricaulis sp.]